MKLKNNINFICIFFLSLILFKSSLLANSSGTSLEDGARNKNLGFEEKDRDSVVVIQQKFLRDIELGRIDKIKLFIKNNGPDINFIINETNPLIHAVSVNNLEIVNFFFKNTSVNIDFTDELGNTALMKACENGSLEIVNYLIENGADINHQNKQGYTPAMKATERNNFYVFKLLIENNADVTKSDFSGRTIKDIAENSRARRILKLLN